MSFLSLMIMAPIFIAPSEEGPAVMTPDGLAWHQVDAGKSRDFDIPKNGKLIVLVRRIAPSEGVAKVRILISQGETQLWATVLGNSGGSQLGGLIAGRARRGSVKTTTQKGRISVQAPDKDHQGILIQLELIPDLAPVIAPGVGRAAERAGAGAAALAEQSGPLTPKASVDLSTPALVAPAATAPDSGSAITVAKATPPPAPEPIPGASGLAKKKEAAALKPPASIATAAPPPPFFLSSVDFGIGARSVVGGLMASNTSFRIGTDMRKPLMGAIQAGVELRLAFINASGNALIPISGMRAASKDTTTRAVDVGGWTMPLMVRLTQTSTTGLQTLLLIGPTLASIQVTPASRTAQSHALLGAAATLRLQPKTGIVMGTTSLRIGAELGWQGLWGDQISSSRAYAGIDLGLPWNL